MSDALVPFIPYDQLDKVAAEFLKEHYPAALKVTPYGQSPVSIDPLAMADGLALTVKQQRIREDASVFGQIYFVETDAEMYDAKNGKTVTMTIPGKTIVFDPQMYLLRNLSSDNNTIIHGCIHWVKHRKVFELEKLYNADAFNISCEVVGGAASAIARSATEQIEKQANQLTSRIQMPAEPFKVKAKEYIARFMGESNAGHENEVMEQVITALETAFSVSKQAAKIRLVELGFDLAIGTYMYLDGYYVKPYTFRKGALKVNQTFSISAQDAAVERFVNQNLCKLTESGADLFRNATSSLHQFQTHGSFAVPLSPVNPVHQWICEALYIKYPEPIWAVREYLVLYGVEIKKFYQKNIGKNRTWHVQLGRSSQCGGRYFF